MNRKARRKQKSTKEAKQNPHPINAPPIPVTPHPIVFATS